MLKQLRKDYVVGFVGGSDLTKQVEQLGVDGRNGLYTVFLANRSLIAY